MQLIQLPRNPRDLTGKVNLIAEDLARLCVGAQGVERAAHYGGGLFLVIEDGEGGGDHDDGEDGRGKEPAGCGGGDGGEGAVGAAFHEGTGARAGGGDDGAAGWAEEGAEALWPEEMGSEDHGGGGGGGDCQGIVR